MQRQAGAVLKKCEGNMVEVEHNNGGGGSARIWRWLAVQLVQFNLLFAVLAGLARLFGEPAIPFWPWMVICNAACLFALALCAPVAWIRQHRERPKR